MPALYSLLDKPSVLALGIAALLSSATTLAVGTIELRLNGEPLANQQVTDYLDGSRSRYTTDARREVRIPVFLSSAWSTPMPAACGIGCCEFCGVSSDLPVYKFDLTKTVTLSGRIEIDELCQSDCHLRFLNLDTGLELNTGSGLTVNAWHTFSETLSAGRYRIILESSNWPTPGSEYLIDSVGVDARDGSVSDIALSVSRITQRNRFGSTPPQSRPHSGGAH